MWFIGQLSIFRLEFLVSGVLCDADIRHAARDTRGGAWFTRGDVPRGFPL